jgi:hypothetical protein
MRMVLLISFLISLQIIALGDVHGPNQPQEVEEISSLALLRSNAWAAQDQGGVDIQWFKEEMKISPKYTEHREGILGMSWLHFLTMAFLIIFFITAIVSIYHRNKRTKQIIISLLQEGRDERKS